MAEKCLRSRCIATTDIEQHESIVTIVDERLVTDSEQTNQIVSSDHVSAVVGVIRDRPAKEVDSASHQATMSAVQLQDILASVKQAIQAEISKQTELQTAALDLKLNSVCENLKSELRKKNEKLAVSLTNQFRSDNEKVRQGLSLRLQTEIQNRSQEISVLRKNTETELAKISKNIDDVCTGMDERVAAHVTNTRKELDRNTREVNDRSKALTKEINEHKIQADITIEGIRQELGETKEGLDRSVEGIENEIRAMSAALQSEKQNTFSEFQKVNLAVSRIEAKITAGKLHKFNQMFATPHTTHRLSGLRM